MVAQRMTWRRCLPWLIVPFFCSAAQALGIDAMLKYTDERGRGEFVVSNSEPERVYVNVTVAELVVENGELKKIPYTTANLDQWAMEVRPARAILEPGFSKRVQATYLPVKGLARLDRDRIFQLSFVPSPYFGEDEKIAPSQGQLKVAFGLAPLLIVPAKPTPRLQYELNYRRGQVTVSNLGQGTISVYLDGCEAVTGRSKSGCSTSVTVLPGRVMKVDVPAGARHKPALQAKVMSYGNTYEQESTLKQQP